MHYSRPPTPYTHALCIIHSHTHTPYTIHHTPYTHALLKVTNTGKVAGKESVLAFWSPPASVDPLLQQQTFAFDGAYLEPGQSATLTFKMPEAVKLATVTEGSKIHSPYTHHTFTIHSPYIHHTFTIHSPCIHTPCTIHTMHCHCH
jgi:hypothetical protein